jgi:hypothetical protein
MIRANVWKKHNIIILNTGVGTYLLVVIATGVRIFTTVVTTNFVNRNLRYRKFPNLMARNYVIQYTPDLPHSTAVCNRMPVTQSFVTDELVASRYKAVLDWNRDPNGNSLLTNVSDLCHAFSLSDIT